VNGQVLENPFGSAFRISGLILIVLLVASACLFLPPLLVPAIFIPAACLWLIFRHPIGALGALLAFMPVDYMVIELGKFFHLPGMTVVSACTKEVPLVLLLFILWHRNGLRLVAPDWFLLAAVMLAALRTVLNGSFVVWGTDFQFVLPYAVGRVTQLTHEQESRWAKRAVWIIAVLAVLGMSEVFIFGGGPRTMLYLATDSVTDNGTLTSAFGGTDFVGLREASTMVGPSYFGALCMIALILWWLYCRNPVPAVMAAAGLVCSITRSAWIGTALAITFLAAALEQWKRWALYVGLGLVMFAASIPILGLSDYLSAFRTGQDTSTEGHVVSTLTGLQIALEHPLGAGNAKVGARASGENGNADITESTYLSLAAEYGIVALVCFIGFLSSATWRAWRTHSQLGRAAIAIMVGVGVMMTILLMHTDRRFNCWVWFPVGLAVRHFCDSAKPESHEERRNLQLRRLLENGGLPRQ